jgi:hypothetical protein
MNTEILFPEPVAWWLRGSLLLAGVWLAAAALQRVSPAGRAMVWRATWLGLLSTTVLVLVSWRLDWRDRGSGMSGNQRVPEMSEESGLGRTVLMQEGLEESPSVYGNADTRGSRIRVADDKEREQGVGWRLMQGIDWVVVAWSVWGAGALVVWWRWLVSLWCRGRLAAAATVVGERGEWATLVREVVGDRERLQLLEHPSVTVPCAWGCWRPTILVPAAATGWSEDQRRMVLAHEWAHLQRRDPVWQVVTMMVLVLHWANPLVWMAQRRWRLAEEEAADDAALNYASPDAYATLLVECARQQVPQSRRLSSSTAFMAHPSTVPQRVRRILDARQDRRPPGAGVGVSCAVIVGVLALVIASATPGLVAQENPAKPPGSETLGDVEPAPIDQPADVTPTAPAAQPTIVQKLQEIILPRVVFHEASIEEAVEFLRRKSVELDTSTTDPKSRGINFVLQLDARDPKPNVSIDLMQVPMKVALSTICQAFGYTPRVEEHAIHISSNSQGTEYITRVFHVPPDFLELAVPEANSDGSTAGPRGIDVLTQAGLEFPEGTTAFFSSKTSTLTVRHTPEVLERVAQFVESINPDMPRMINVRAELYRLPKQQALEMAESLDALSDATAAVKELRARSAEAGEVVLVAAPSLQTRSGMPARVQSGRGRRAEPVAAGGPGNSDDSAASKNSPTGTSSKADPPSRAESGFQGCILEVVPTLGADLMHLDITVDVTYVPPAEASREAGRVASLQTATTMRAGQIRLMGTLSEGETDETMTLVFLKTDVTPRR